MKLPPHKQEVLKRITAELQQLTGVEAIVLGGSYAAGLASDDSDLDIGIYYYEKAPFAIPEIRELAARYDQQGLPTVTGLYEWGPWVNGGAWIQTKAGKVDLLYKNIDQVSTTIDLAGSGNWENHFEQQPPYGFSSLIFLGETECCVPLYDPKGIIEKLKTAIRPYPPKLKEAVVRQSLWSAEFTIWQAEKFARQGDIYNTTGCLTRAVKNIVTALFSMNGLYPLGDKRAVGILEKSSIRPDALTDRIDEILCARKDALPHHVSLLKQLFEDTVALTGGGYTPFYSL